MVFVLGLVVLGVVALAIQIQMLHAVVKENNVKLAAIEFNLKTFRDSTSSSFDTILQKENLTYDLLVKHHSDLSKQTKGTKNDSN